MRELPGGPVLRIQCFHCRGMGSVPGWGTKDPASCLTQQKKKKKRKMVQKVKNSKVLLEKTEAFKRV